MREHPTKGPFVEGVVTATVTTARETERLLVEGQARRAVAGTNMNETSSRSHAIFTIVATKVERDLQTGAEGFTTSKVTRICRVCPWVTFYIIILQQVVAMSSGERIF